MHKKIRLLFIPIVFSNMLLPLIGLFNVYILGNVSNHNCIASFGVGISVVNFIVNVTHFLKMTTTGLVAQAFGQKDYKKCAVIFNNALMLGVFIGIFIISLLPLIKYITFKLFHGDTKITKDAFRFIIVRIYAIPFYLITNIIGAFFVSIQRPKLSLYMIIAYSGFYVVLSCLFLFCSHLTLYRLGQSELMAQILVSTIALWSYYHYFIKKYSLKMFVSTNEIGQYLKVNADIFIRSLLLISSLTLFTVVSSKLGALVLAINTIVLSIQAITSNIIDALANAIESLVGQFYNNNKHNMRLVIKTSFVWMTIISLLLTLVYCLFGQSLIEILSNSISIQQSTLSIWPEFLFLTLVSCVSYWVDGLFIGMMKTRVLMIAMVLSACTFFMLNFLFPAESNNTLLFYLIVFFCLRSSPLLYLITVRLAKSKRFLGSLLFE